MKPRKPIAWRRRTLVKKFKSWVTGKLFVVQQPKAGK